MAERIKNLNKYQKGFLAAIIAMVLIFTVVYAVTISRVGFAYKDVILVPSEENGVTVYSGKLEGQKAQFTVSEDNSVVFQYGDKIYGPYTSIEDPTAIPQDHAMKHYMTGVELYEKGPNKGRVKSAQFIFFETDEQLPYAVKYLTKAEELYFFSNVNSFQKEISLGKDICSLTELKRLTMFAYGLTEIPDEIANMTSLRFLDLGGNNFSSIPKALKKCKSLTALILTSNQKSTVTDMSNTVRTDDELGGLVKEFDSAPSDGTNASTPDKCTRKFPQWLLEWDQLDTLRLSVNYLQGILPSDEELLEAGFEAWNVDDPSTFTSEVTLVDSLSTEGITFFKENRIPKVLPDIDFFAINLNRLHGNIPKWLKYHPKLDYWYPLQLVFPQEGRDKDGHQAGFIDVPTNLNYYYDIYKNKKWSSINTIE